MRTIDQPWDQVWPISKFCYNSTWIIYYFFLFLILTSTNFYNYYYHQYCHFVFNRAVTKYCGFVLPFPQPPAMTVDVRVAQHLT